MAATCSPLWATAWGVAFQRVSDAVAAAVELQESFSGHEWGPDSLRVRMGVHTGEAVERDADYFGPAASDAPIPCLRFEAQVSVVGPGPTYGPLGVKGSHGDGLSKVPGELSCRGHNPLRVAESAWIWAAA